VTHPITSPAAPVTASLRDLFRVRGYRALCLSSVIWHTTRWGGLFTTTYLLTATGASPMLIQEVGALLVLPLLVGGFLGGLVSDRFDRKRLVVATQLLLVPVQVAMLAVVALGVVEVWMCVPFMLCLGLGGLVNMTAQRPFIYELVGSRHASRAMTIESTVQAGSIVFGALAGGALIERIGVAAAYAAMAGLLVVATLLLLTVPSTRDVQQRARGVSLAGQLRVSARLVHRSRRLVATLLVTVAMNLFLFSYVPLVPAVAADLAAGALFAGALAAAEGVGQLVGGVVLARTGVRRHGLVFAGGGLLGLVGLLVFAVVPVPGVAFAALFAAGVGHAGFSATQAMLAIESAAPSERGAALGVLSTAIGAMPLGMVLVGVLASATGARTALAVSAVLGVASVGAVLLRMPELRQRTAPDGMTGRDTA